MNLYLHFQYFLADFDEIQFISSTYNATDY